METGRPLRIITTVEPGSETAVLDALRSGGYVPDCRRVSHLDDLRDGCASESWDLAILSDAPPPLAWQEAVSTMRAVAPGLPIALLTPAFDATVVAQAESHDLEDCISLDQLARLPLIATRVLRAQAERRRSQQTEGALRNSEEQYRRLVENANDVVLTADLTGNFTAMNAAGERISGYGRDELLMMNMSQFLAPESLALAQQMIRQKLVDNRPTVYQVEMISRDGRRIPLELSTTLVEQDGVPVGVQCTARDITDRKRAAEALRESEQRYRGLFENASDLMYTHDLRGWINTVNGAAERILGYQEDEVLHRSITNLVVPEHVERARRMTQAKLDGDVMTTYELDVIAKDGRRVTLEINSQLLFAGGEPVGVQGVARDVTERRRAEQMLRARERRQAALAELGQRAVATGDLQRFYTDAVDSILDTLDVDYSALLQLDSDAGLLRSCAGAGWRPGLVGLTVPSGSESLSGYALVSGEPLVVTDLPHEARFAIPTVLMEHQVRSALSVVVPGASQPFGVLSAYTRQSRTFTQEDVHYLQSVAAMIASAIRRTALEEERARHGEELATRVIEAQEEERKRIARELHDETAQSLSMLLTHLDLVQQQIAPQERGLTAGLERVQQLARRTLDETRALSHDLRPSILDDAGLDAALRWLAAEYRETYGLPISIRSEPLPAIPSAVELTLFRIAQEGLTNTCKHAGASRASVRLRCRDSHVILAITDNGQGFDVTALPASSHGTHLGLYGMRERVALLGGDLRIETAPGGGTRIDVTVPLNGMAGQ